jgi:hypothetical protein
MQKSTFSSTLLLFLFVSVRTAKTEVRNLFLEERCAKVATVPYFEFDKSNSPEKRVAYVRDLLTKEGLL